MIPSLNFFQGIFQVLGLSPVTPPRTEPLRPASPTTAPSSSPTTPTPNATNTVSNTTTTESTGLQNRARLFACLDQTSSPLYENPRLPWVQILREHESPWVRPGLRWGQNISGMNTTVLRVASNERQQGCRHSEFRFDATANPNGANLCVAANTNAELAVGIRTNDFGGGIRQPIIYPPFRARYVDERGVTGATISSDGSSFSPRSPLDPSARTPFPFGPWILNVRGFSFYKSNTPMPDPNNPSPFDLMYPPVIPLEEAVQICNAAELANHTCTYDLRYSFGGVIEPFARESPDSKITDFWESYGYDWNEETGGFYQRANLQRDSIDMGTWSFIDNIVRPLATKEARDYLRANYRTWTPNFVALLGPNFQGLSSDIQSTPDTYVFPDCSQLTLHQAQPIQNFIQSAIQDPNFLLLDENTGATPRPSASFEEATGIPVEETQRFFNDLAAAYTNPHRVNQIHIESSDEAGPPLNARQIEEGVGSESGPLRNSRLGSQIQVLSPALSFNWASSESPSEHFNFSRFLARKVEFSAPSLSTILTSLFGNSETILAPGRPSHGPWNDTTPFQLHLDHPYFSNLSMDFGSFHLTLPQMWAEDINITLPSLAEIGQILHVTPNTELTLDLFKQNLRKIVDRIDIKVRGLRVAGHFELDYRENEFHLEGEGGRVENLHLRSLISSSEASTSISPHQGIPLDDSQSDEIEIAHLRSMIPNYEGRDDPQRPIPLLYISGAGLHHVQTSFRPLGSLVADGNQLENFRAYFPPHQIATSISRIESSGRFSYLGDTSNKTVSDSPYHLLSQARRTSWRPGRINLFSESFAALNLGPLDSSTSTPTLSSPPRVVLDPEHFSQNVFIHPERTEFHLRGNSQIEDVRLTFDMRKPGITYSRLRTRVTGDVEPGSIAYPSANVRVQFGEHSHIHNVLINANTEFEREESGHEFDFDVTYSGNMALNVANVSYGRAEQAPYLLLNEILGTTQNACIYASRAQIFVSQPSDFGGPCDLSEEYRHFNMRELRNRPPVAAQSPISLHVGVERLLGNLDANRFNMSGTIDAGLNYFLLDNDDSGLTTVAIDINAPHATSLAGNIDAIIRGQHYQTELDPNPSTPNELGARRVYAVLTLPTDSQELSIREFRMDELSVHISRGLPGTNAYTLLNSVTHLYEFWTPEQRRAAFANILGTLDAIFPGLAPVYWGPRRNHPQR